MIIHFLGLHCQQLSHSHTCLFFY